MKKRDFRKLLKETKDLLTSIDYVFALNCSIHNMKTYLKITTHHTRHCNMLKCHNNNRCKVSHYK